MTSSPDPKGYTVYCFMPVAAVRLLENGQSKAEKLDGQGGGGIGVPSDLPSPPTKQLKQEDKLIVNSSSGDALHEGFSEKFKYKIPDADPEMESSIPKTVGKADKGLLEPTVGDSVKLGGPVNYNDRPGRRVSFSEKTDMLKGGAAEEKEPIERSEVMKPRFPYYIGMYYK